LKKFNIPHNFEFTSIITLYAQWIREGRLKINSDWNKDLGIKFTCQDPCNIVRKTWGEEMAKDLRYVIKAIVGEENFIDMVPCGTNNYCCGAQSTTGAVMVVGGGIAGIQASLDLADSGYRVVLAEKRSAIGGVMSQLDKTFPTNDCSMCIISPKLVEAGRHLNIDLYTMTDVKAVTGEAGNFTATLRQRPRFIDLERCTACGECSKVCPIDVPNDFDQGLRARKAAFKRYPQAMPSAYTIEKKGTAPCKAACPANPSVQGCVALMAQGKYKEAFELFRSEHPFPGICGRICHHPCETPVPGPIRCTRLHHGPAPFSGRLGQVKRSYRDPPKEDKTGKRKWPSWAAGRPA
jgi:NAD-dependent dihydropyrimidine dehydrogenase PreA subunit